MAEAWSRDEFPHEIARRVGELGYNHISGMTEDPLFRGHLMAELAARNAIAMATGAEAPALVNPEVRG